MAPSLMSLMRRIQAIPDEMANQSPYLTLAVVCSAMFLDRESALKSASGLRSAY